MAKTITTINIKSSLEIPNSTQESSVDAFSLKDLFLDKEHNCPLCGSELLLTHVTEFIANTTHEEAECEPCQITVRSQFHPLQ